ncbi:hypothetical protein M9H77_12501 [Catharanthus roseus]|uniref:Uncharacterized protein n=1 Tax=Catharanthus roseus TaxID=4058 RepID=A0ACC0BHN5_CATRO|nr:hypothetical protein M9H77_12501 [Catharanthus roseus]
MHVNSHTQRGYGKYNHHGSFETRVQSTYQFYDGSKHTTPRGGRTGGLGGRGCNRPEEEVSRHEPWHEDNMFDDYGENSNIGQEYFGGYYGRQQGYRVLYKDQVEVDRGRSSVGGLGPRRLVLTTRCWNLCLMSPYKLVHFDRVILARILGIPDEGHLVFYERASTSIFTNPTWFYSEDENERKWRPAIPQGGDEQSPEVAKEDEDDEFQVQDFGLEALCSVLDIPNGTRGISLALSFFDLGGSGILVPDLTARFCDKDQAYSSIYGGDYILLMVYDSGSSMS